MAPTGAWTSPNANSPRTDAYAIAAPVFLADDAAAELAITLAADAHDDANETGTLAAHATRVATALTLALTPHP